MVGKLNLSGRKAYIRDRGLQGKAIPDYLVEGYFNSRPAIMLSEIYWLSGLGVVYKI